MQTSMRHSKLPPQFQNVSTRLVLCTRLAPPNRRSHGTPTPRGKMASHAVQHESQVASHLVPLPTTAAPSCAQCMAHMCNLQYATQTWQQRPQPVHEPVSAAVTQQCACHAAAAFLQRRQLHVALVCESAAPLCSLAFESSLAPTCFGTDLFWRRLVPAPRGWMRRPRFSPLVVCSSSGFVQINDPCSPCLDRLQTAARAQRTGYSVPRTNFCPTLCEQSVLLFKITVHQN